ncbi:MAG: hypothetical protein AB1488_08135 [Nitrospirota bacterium]
MSRKFLILTAIGLIVFLHMMTGDVATLKKDLQRLTSEVEKISIEYSKIQSQRDVELKNGVDVLNALKGLPVSEVKVADNTVYFSPKDKGQNAYKILTEIKTYMEILGENCFVTKVNPLQFKVYVAW